MFLLTKSCIVELLNLVGFEFQELHQCLLESLIEKRKSGSESAFEVQKINTVKLSMKSINEACNNACTVLQFTWMQLPALCTRIRGIKTWAFLSPVWVFNRFCRNGSNQTRRVGRRNGEGPIDLNNFNLRSQHILFPRTGNCSKACGGNPATSRPNMICHS